MHLDSLEKLYIHELKDLYSAENQVLDVLPAMIDACQDGGLRDALTAHLAATKTQIERIVAIFDRVEFEPGGHRCKGMSGLIVEAKEVLGEVTDDSVIDAAIIAGMQRMAHYEIAAYGVARALASKLSRSQDVEMLTCSIEEEGAADRALTRLAEHHINFVASV